VSMGCDHLSNSPGVRSERFLEPREDSYQQDSLDRSTVLGLSMLRWQKPKATATWYEKYEAPVHVQAQSRATEGVGTLL
jgi:hypothetical protein